MSKHTPGPWFHDSNGSIWRRDPKDLYQNGGTVAGDKSLATIHKGWHHDGAEGYPVEANARLIAAAPELLEALVQLEEAFCSVGPGMTREDREDSRAALIAARAAIAKARGDA